MPRHSCRSACRGPVRESEPPGYTLPRVALALPAIMSLTSGHVQGQAVDQRKRALRETVTTGQQERWPCPRRRGLRCTSAAPTSPCSSTTEPSSPPDDVSVEEDHPSRSFHLADQARSMRLATRRIGRRLDFFVAQHSYARVQRPGSAADAGQAPAARVVIAPCSPGVGLSSPMSHEILSHLIDRALTATDRRCWP